MRSPCARKATVRANCDSRVLHTPRISRVSLTTSSYFTRANYKTGHLRYLSSKKSFRQRKPPFTLPAWYFLNVQFNIINKTIYNYFPFPWFVSCVHLGVGLLIMTFFWTTKLVKFEKRSQEFLKALTLRRFCTRFGHCLSNVSFATVAVSFTHTVKTLEPVFSAVGVYLVSGTVYPLPVYLALIPVIGGGRTRLGDRICPSRGWVFSPRCHRTLRSRRERSLVRSLCLK